MADDKSEKEFTVVDRRAGVDDESGAETTSRDEETKTGPDTGAGEPAGKTASKEAPADNPAPGPATDEGREEVRGDERGPLPPETFPTFLLSLHTSALIHLGLIPDPINNHKVVNLELARQNIDLLEMLQAKTEGNRTEEESKLFDNILYELRMAYVQVCEAAGKGECKE